MIGAPQLASLRFPAWAIGLGIGILLSLADAVITKAYAPIILFGAVGGAIVGWIVGKFGA